KPVPAALWEPGWGEGARRRGREGKGEKFHLQGFLESGKAKPGFKERLQTPDDQSFKKINTPFFD
ncbi:MAG: hypothetical protein ACO2OU_03715, partial [Thermus aquaticus]|uniref:hypothetical protein n=1 Tax=Thermus aquaticus TaxID=271 RepID=UPI003C0F84C1